MMAQVDEQCEEEGDDKMRGEEGDDETRGEEGGWVTRREGEEGGDETRGGGEREEGGMIKLTEKETKGKIEGNNVELITPPTKQAQAGATYGSLQQEKKYIQVNQPY